jgi:hypothetical protein
MTWNNDFWTRLGGEQPSLRLDMYYRRRDDLRLPVELVAGEPRVPVDAHVLALLDRVDQDVLFERVKDDRQRKNWTTNAAADLLDPQGPQRIWELLGLYHLYVARVHEALALFWRLYDQLLVAQESAGRVHKGMP